MMPIRLLLTLLFPAALPAQLHLTARLGVADHSGHARDEADPEQPTFGPGTTRDGTIALGLDRGVWRFAISVRRETPDLVLVGESSGIITRNALESWHAGIELGHRVAGHPALPSLHVLVGAGVTRWSFPGFDYPPRSRLGAWAAMEGATPLVGRLGGVIRLEGMRTASLFEGEDLPEGYESLSARRLGLSLGLRWRR
jgi:hypothetical protein